MTRMFEQLKEEVTELHTSKEFKTFKKKSPNSYLCAGFMIIEQLKKVPWQIDYYCPDKKTITTFSVGKKVEAKETNKISASGDPIKELNLENIDVDFEHALKIIDSLLTKKYPDEKASKVITVLQHMKEAEVWNITYITQRFNILNVRINAEDGQIIEEKLQPVFSFKKE